MEKPKDIRVSKKKLEELNDIWINSFYTYPYLQGKVKFTEEKKSDYVGVIFGYFHDSFDIVFSENSKGRDTFLDVFSYHIGLLQSIFVQQDIIEELLRIFKTKVERDTLKADLNYKTNRDIRNELIGHPINRDNGKLCSSSLLGYGTSRSVITYLKYEFLEETNVVQTVEIKDVFTRHKEFLNNIFRYTFIKIIFITRII